MFALIFFGLFLVEGNSMSHIGIDDGDYVRTIHAPCPAGSIIAFEYENQSYIKTLDHYTGRGDIWVVGRDGIWVKKNGRKARSYDSTIYGYIPSDKYNIIGCVQNLTR